MSRGVARRRAEACSLEQVCSALRVPLHLFDRLQIIDTVFGKRRRLVAQRHRTGRPQQQYKN